MRKNINIRDIATTMPIIVPVVIPEFTELGDGGSEVEEASVGVTAIEAGAACAVV